MPAIEFPLPPGKSYFGSYPEEPLGVAEGQAAIVPFAGIIETHTGLYRKCSGTSFRSVRHPTENNLPKLRSLDHIKHLFSFARRQAHSERSC
uniref:Uncharacterized protein n=1 Tax=Candidatus Kentrum sp. FM TaxID=2126340 RepID=A0A450SUW6_9GAMM|nr:MAG: hypothetical protein BECKFM1743A_GA0114220_102006 [Candidatus Kentron sp. FM]VFJ58942.1 MAG: hypothetical protein BECKFM1743C_GA0114222_102363 [Candidatus Kentron sp. FM]VFK12741.1 MAG: hypothetical protein BECKFM1743B_GA0114221_102533 [Candidatus Kentron sp. FM]